jgi:RNA recognition motif-containing protein
VQVEKEELLAALKTVEPGLETLDLPAETGWGAGAGRSRGFAFAQFFNEASATRCLKRLSGA